MNQATPKIENAIDRLIGGAGTARAVLDQLTLGEAEELIRRLIEMLHAELERNPEYDPPHESATTEADQQAIAFEEEAAALHKLIADARERLHLIEGRTHVAELAIKRLGDRVEIVETHVRGMADVRTQIDRSIDHRIASLEAKTVERTG